MADPQQAHKASKLDVLFRLPVAQKFLILGGVNMLMLAGIFYGLVNPKMEEVKTLKVDLQVKTDKLRSNEEIAEDIPRFQKEKEELEEKLQAALRKLPNEKDLENFIDSISDAGKESGLDVLKFKPGREVPKGFYAQLPISMSVSGSYESFFLFCTKVGSLSRIVNIENITVSASKNLIKSSFNVTTFMFLPDSKIGKKKKK